MEAKNWHEKHVEKMSFGDRIADAVANGMGSWNFIIWQSVIVILWMILNVIGILRHWDEYPFILLNLIFSTQAAYAAPIIIVMLLFTGNIGSFFTAVIIYYPVCLLWAVFAASSYNQRLIDEAN